MEKLAKLVLVAVLGILVFLIIQFWIHEEIKDFFSTWIDFVIFVVIGVFVISIFKLIK